MRDAVTIKHLSQCLLLWLVAGFGSVAQAHSVISAAYIEGQWIEGEVGFSNGDMALPGTPVKVQINGTAAGGTEIGEHGVFRWPIESVAEYRFLIDLSAGHVAEVIVSEAEIRSLATGLDAVTASRPEASTTANQVKQSTSSSTTSSEPIEALVGAAVARQLKPLRKEIVQLRNKNELRDLLGGLGLIAGFFGVLYGFSAHRKLKQQRTDAHNTEADDSRATTN